MKRIESIELLRLGRFSNHRHSQTWQLLVTKNAVRGSPNHTILRRPRQPARRRRRGPIGPYASRLTNPIVAGARPHPFAKTTRRVKHPRPNLLRLRVPADPLAPLQDDLALANDLK